MTVVSADVIPVLLVVLILAAIAAVARIFSVLGSVKETLDRTRADVDRTIAEVNRVMGHVEGIANSAEQLIQGEVTQTLKVTHATLANIEIMTRAAADATVSIRRITGKAETAAASSGILTAGTMAIKLLSGRQGGVGGSLLSGLSWGMRAVFGHKRSGAKQAPGRNGKKPPKNEIVVTGEPAAAHRKRTDRGD